MAGLSFPCRRCGRSVNIIANDRPATQALPDSSGKDSSLSSVPRLPQTKHLSRVIGGNPPAVIAKRHGRESRRASASTPVITTQTVVPLATPRISISEQADGINASESVQSTANRVVIAAATCISLAIATATYAVFQNESRRDLERSEKAWRHANNVLNDENIPEAGKLFKQYSDSWRAPNRGTALTLLEQIALVTSEKVLREKLAALNDQQFEQAIANKSLQDSGITHPVLVRALAESIAKHTNAVTQQRVALKAKKAEEDAAIVAQQKQDRLAREEAVQKEREAKEKLAGSTSKLQRYLGLNQWERKTLWARIAAIENSLNLSELSSKTVFHQQVGRVEACIEMTSLVALSLGATPEKVENISSRQSLVNITADNVYQQLAGHLNVYVDMMELAAVSAGAPIAKCNLIRSTLRLEDTLSRTFLQQVSSRIGGISAIATLLAEALGAENERLVAINSHTSANEKLDSTVFQQMVSRQSGICYLIATAAVAQGAPPDTLETVEAAARSDDVLTGTAQQQLAARLERTFQTTTLLAKAIVEK